MCEFSGNLWILLHLLLLPPPLVAAESFTEHKQFTVIKVRQNMQAYRLTNEAFALNYQIIYIICRSKFIIVQSSGHNDINVTTWHYQSEIDSRILPLRGFFFLIFFFQVSFYSYLKFLFLIFLTEPPIRTSNRNFLFLLKKSYFLNSPQLF